MSTKLDEILRRIHVVPTAEDIGDIWEKRETDVLDVASARQAILQWVNNEVIGNMSHKYQRDYRAGTGSPTQATIIADVVKEKAVNKKINQQREILKQYGWRG